MRIPRSCAVALLALAVTVTVTACSSATPTGPANPGAVVQAIATAQAAASGPASADSGSAQPDSAPASADSGSGSGSASADPFAESADTTTEAQTGPPLVAGPVMPGTDLPMPLGLDCSGSNTSKDAKGDLICGGDVSDPTAVYNYFLKALPKAGFPIGSTAYQKQGSNGLSAAIYFNGTKFDGIDAVTFSDNDVSISLNVI